MRLHDAQQEDLEMSGISQISTFALKATRKSFQILSSSLYGNKIRAIIRELSTNALDSHVAACNVDTPFEVHLPTLFEPWFSVRDFGTGMSHEQVTQLYSVYFESTKTQSNDFVGALGLGSKSPFSYTNNFTVTSVHDGVRGTYSAFINDQGVPSIALLSQQDTDEPPGVTVMMSVESDKDFIKFYQEAAEVYQWFKHRPTITGRSDFQFKEPEYEAQNIVPGVHRARPGVGRSLAIMGNIAYPIEVPNAAHHLGADLSQLLANALVMEFDLGELDFQPSREGLSYIQPTIEAIKDRLTELAAGMYQYLVDQLVNIPNAWHQHRFLAQKYNEQGAFWRGPVRDYIKKTQCTHTTVNSYQILPGEFSFEPRQLADDYNIKFTKFDYVYKAFTQRDRTGEVDIRIGPQSWCFVINDCGCGIDQFKKRYRKYSGTVKMLGLISPADRKLPMNTKKFFDDIMSPPDDCVIKVSDLPELEPAPPASKRSVKGGILVQDYRDCWQTSNIDDPALVKGTVYYVPMSGYEFLSPKYGNCDTTGLIKNIINSGLLPDCKQIYGVRKMAMSEVLKCKNWVNIDEHMESVLMANLAQSTKKLVHSIPTQRMGLLKQLLPLVPNTSVFHQVTSVATSLKGDSSLAQSVKELMHRYLPGKLDEMMEFKSLVSIQLNEFYDLYPMVALLRTSNFWNDDELQSIVDYVLMVEKNFTTPPKIDKILSV